MLVTTPAPLTQALSRDSVQLWDEECLSARVAPGEESTEFLNDEDSERIQQIKAFLESKEGLDVWQWTAFKIGTEWKNVDSKMQCCDLLLYLQYPLFAFTCQCVAVFNLMRYYFDYTYAEPDWMSDDVYYVMLFLFSVVILFSSLNILKSMAVSGLYGALHHTPTVATGWCLELFSFPFIGDALQVFVDCDFVYTPLLAMGYFTNLFLWACCLILNMIILELSDSPLDVVLNIVAVFFILEIDDMLVPLDAYDEMLKWFEDSSNLPRMKTIPISSRKYKGYVVLNMIQCAVLSSPVVVEGIRIIYQIFWGETGVEDMLFWVLPLTVIPRLIIRVYFYFYKE